MFSEEDDRRFRPEIDTSAWVRYVRLKASNRGGSVSSGVELYHLLSNKTEEGKNWEVEFCEKVLS